MASFDVVAGTARTVASGSAERGAPANVAGQLDLGGRLETSPPAGRGIGTATGVARAGGLAAGVATAAGTADASPVIRRPIDLRVASGDSETIAPGAAPRFQPVDVAGEVNVAGELNVLDEPGGIAFGSATASPKITPNAPGLGLGVGASLPAGLAAGVGLGLGTATATPTFTPPFELSLAAGDTRTIPLGVNRVGESPNVAGELNVGGELDLVEGGHATATGSATASPKLSPIASGLGVGLGAATSVRTTDRAAAGVGLGLGTATATPTRTDAATGIGSAAAAIVEALRVQPFTRRDGFSVSYDPDEDIDLSVE